MKQFKNKYRTRENLLFLFLWIFVFVSPIILSTGDNKLDTTRIIHEWIRILPFFVLFCLNNFLIFKYFIQKKSLKYLIFIALVIFITAIPSTYIHLIFNLLYIPQPKLPHNPETDFYYLLNKYFYNIIFGILTVGVNNAIKIAANWEKDKRKLEHLENENLKIQLTHLQQQVSPHFFMNTLNNIHSLVDIDTEQAKEAIIKLSVLMRYLLYEASKEKIQLHKEIEFIRSYISLYQIRFSDKVDIKTTITEENFNIQIPPMLFVSFIENAFKYGISYQTKSFVYIDILITQNSIRMKIMNSKHKTNNKTESEYSGFGLDNIKRRLNLLYADNYKLVIIDKDNEFEVNLIIPL
jgi:sensor histidine kinase YesM